MRSLWFDLYFVVFVAIFTAVWMWFSPHPWAWWSIPGSALILFATYFQVQVSVAVNTWYGPFYDMIQAALSKSRPVTVEEFYGELATFAGIALVAVIVGVLTRFFVSHYIFRWRTAMNDFYVATGRGCAPSKAPRSASRKTRCDLQPSPNASASISSARS